MGLAITLSLLIHVVWLMLLGVAGAPAQPSATAFAKNDTPEYFARLVSTYVPDASEATTKVRAGVESMQRATVARADTRIERLVQAEVFDLPISAPPPEIFVASSELQRPAELLLPFEADLIPGAANITGRLTLEIKVDKFGKVRDVKVIDSLDPGGAMERVVVPWLKASPFQPGRKDGVAVNSVVLVRLNLVPPAPIDPNYRATRSPGQPLWMDNNGKFINDAPSPVKP